MSVTGYVEEVTHSFTISELITEVQPVNNCDLVVLKMLFSSTIITTKNSKCEEQL